MINPDLIKKGDQVTLASANGVQQIGTVVLSHRPWLTVEIAGGDLHTLNLAGKRSLFQIVAHQPRLL